MLPASTMTDAFTILGLPPVAALTEEQVRAAYFEKSKAADADNASLNAAFELLLAPDKRLKHLIDLAAPPEAKQWRTVAMGEDLMDLFMALGKVRPQAEALVEKRQKAQSALGRALLEKQTFAVRDSLEQTGFALDQKRQDLEAELPGLGEHDWPRLAEAQARFTYLAKWQTQVRELLLKLM